MSERRITAQHAVTVLVGQLAIMAYGVTDTIVAGNHSVDALAALSVAGAIFLSVYISLLAAVQGLLPIWAELHGARQPRRIGASVRQCLYLTAALTALGMLLLAQSARMLDMLQVPAAIQGDVARYLRILAAALPAAMFYRMFTTLSQSIGIPQMVTILQVAGLFIKIPLSIWWVRGGWGMPAMGLSGCAWATLVVHYSLLALALALTRMQPQYQPLQLWRRLEAPHWPQLRGFLRLSLPAGLAAGVEISSFALMALLIARQGSIASSAHQIAANLAGIGYMFPLSLGIACSARVSYWRGAGNEPRAQQAARDSLRAGLAITAALALSLAATRHWLAMRYSGDPAVQQLSASLLMIVAIYHVADSMQLIGMFMLRCYRITLAPLFIYPVMLWGFGIGGGYFWAYQGWGQWPAARAPWPFWAASAVGLAFTALAFLWLLRKAMRNAGAAAQRTNHRRAAPQNVPG